MNYSEFKSILLSKHLFWQFRLYQDTIENDKEYHLFAIDNSITYNCRLNSTDHPTEIEDFETNYRDTSNQPVDSKDPISGMMKTKPRTVYGVLASTYVYFTTGDINSLNSGNNTDWSIEYADGVTKVSYNPAFNYTTEGGSLKLIGEPSNPITTDLILAPDYPAAIGGSWYFLGNRVFEAGNTDKFNIIVPTKYIQHNADYPLANKMQLKVQHDPSESVKMEIFMRIYM